MEIKLSKKVKTEIKRAVEEAIKTEKKRLEMNMIDIFAKIFLLLYWTKSKKDIKRALIKNLKNTPKETLQEILKGVELKQNNIKWKANLLDLRRKNKIGWEEDYIKEEKELEEANLAIEKLQLSIETIKKLLKDKEGRNYANKRRIYK